MLVTIEQAHEHLRTDPDEQIEIYLRAAELYAQEFLCRKVYPTIEAMSEAIEDGSAGDDPMVINDLIRAAILLIVGHLYTNREQDVVGVSVAELKMGALALLQPYRKGMGV